MQIMQTLKNLFIPKTPKTPRKVIDPRQDIGNILGQNDAKTAILVAAAGNHHLLLIGSPGEGKTTLAKMLPSILPSLTPLELSILDNLHLQKTGQAYKHTHQRPFCSVHHTTTITALIGGYSSNTKTIVPGLVSLASFGILFLDEFTEFKHDQLEALRQPISDNQITVNRAQGSQVYPTTFTLIAAANPCRCGYAGTCDCTCTPKEIRRYLRSMSGPILDRIDITARLYPLSPQERLAKPNKGQSAQLYYKVLQARIAQARRNYNQCSNADIPADDITTRCLLTTNAIKYLTIAMDRPRFSTRKLIKLCRVARTIADLSSSNYVETIHLQSALELATFDIQTEYQLME